MNKIWQEFFIGKIGTLKRGKDNLSDSSIGHIPLISASKDSNGINKFTCGKKLLFCGNSITINNNGSIGYCFYQSHSFYATSDVTVMHNNKLNKYNSLFLNIAIKFQKDKYKYGYKFSNPRMIRQKIMLPIHDNNQPEYEYMEQFTKSIIDRKIITYTIHIKSKITNLTYKNIKSLNQKKWQEFYISGEKGIFNIESSSSGIDKNKLPDITEKTYIPYITRKEKNNGIDLFITKKQQEKYKIDKKNVITIGLDTQTAFYQPHNFYTGQNIQVLQHKKLNENNALFIIPSLKIQMEKLNWGGNGATLGRLENTKIMLPVNANGEPDYKYMEQYIINMKLQKLKQYLAYCKKEYNL